jgi:hypothetical protein
VLAVAAAASPSVCKNLTTTNQEDFAATTRSAAYPQGASGLDLSGCFALCCATSDCALFAFLGGGSGKPADNTCWPLSAASGLGPASDPNHYIGLPPTPPPVPPPASWLPRIAAADMLYTPDDSSVQPSQMPEVGNGFLATQIMTDTIFVAGLFNGYLTKDPSHRARVPATNAVAAPGNQTGAALDVREATYFRRSFIDPSPPGACTAASTQSCSNAPQRIFVEQRWYAHRALPSLLVMEVQVLPGGNSDKSGGEGGHEGGGRKGGRSAGAGAGANAVEGVDAPPYAMLRLVNSPGGASGDLSLAPVTLPPGLPYSVVNGSTLVAETNSSGLQAVCVLTTNLPAGGALAVAADAPFGTAFFFTVIRSSIETAPADLVAAAQADYAQAAALSEQGKLRSSHIAEWEETAWAAAGLETDRLDAARPLNSSLYAIISSFRSDRPFGLGPGGLTGAYNGHAFWDTESFMYPPINLLHPDLALSLLQYRANRIAGAEKKAGTYSPPFAGAMFPWESALTGEETCPESAPTGHSEMHINSDIVFCVWQTWRALMDNSAGFLNATAWPLVSGIAAFWMSKLAIDNPGAGPEDALHLLQVIGPDESTGCCVNDSAFTNAGAILALQRAAVIGELLGQQPALLAPWRNAAARIVIPYDAAFHYHPEHAGYQRGGKVGGIEVALLGYPLELAGTIGGAIFTPETLANDLLYYLNVSDPGLNSMTWDIFAIGLMQLGKSYAPLAASYFNKSFSNANGPFLVWTEGRDGTGTPNFLTAAGACLQSFAFGYTGLRINDANVSLSPSTPEASTTFMRLRGVAYLGCRLDISLDFAAETMSVAVAAPNTDQRSAAEVDAAGFPVVPADSLSLAPRQPLSLRSQRGRVLFGGTGGAAPVIVVQRALELVDAAGSVHALAPGSAPVSIALQPVTIRAAAAAATAAVTDYR